MKEMESYETTSIYKKNRLLGLISILW